MKKIFITIIVLVAGSYGFPLTEQTLENLPKLIPFKKQTKNA